MAELIAVDKDEVVGALVDGLLVHHNREYGTGHTFADYYTYDFAQLWGCDTSESVRRVYGFLHQEGHQIKPIPGAIEALGRLSAKYELVILTARHEQFTDMTNEWIDMYLPGVFKQVLLAGNHYDGSQKKTKGQVCVDIGASYLIDDSPANAISCINTGVKPILFGDYQWNRQDIPDEVVRCASWHEVEEFLNEQK